MKKSLILLLFVGFNGLLFAGKNNLTDFDIALIPQQPDYSNEDNWSALPWREDTADDVPNDTYQNNQANAAVDVFFIHPTTIMAKDGVWNADVTNEKANKKIDNLPVQHQASVFNGVAKVYAPRYRQANYEAFMQLGTSNSNQALQIAYQDVKSAFLYYLENYNEGRPFIIAGHSQGTFHAIRLIQELVDTTELLDQMVNAYLVGMPVEYSSFQVCRPCMNEVENHCYLTWNTMKKKSYPKFYDQYFKDAVCHNPLSWETNEFYCDAKFHEGMVPKEFKKLLKHRYGAQVHCGILWVDAVKIPGIPFTRLVKNWHIGDYNLFYGNIRENLTIRVDHFLEHQFQTQEIVDTQ